MKAKIMIEREISDGMDSHAREVHPVALQDPALLTDEEKITLVECEKIISKNLAGFFETGTALAKVRDQRLYRAAFPTFEEYCRKQWDISRFHAFRQIQGAEILKRLLPMGNIPLPKNERQVRPLAGLPINIAERAWKKAVAASGCDRPTGKVVAQAVKELTKHPKQHTGVGLHTREEWQRLVEPLLREALEYTARGNREAVEQIAFKLQLNLEIGRERSISDE